MDAQTCHNISGVSYYHQARSSEGLSSILITRLLRSIDPETLCTYCRHWNQFKDWMARRKMCISQVTVNVIGLFLVHMFEKGYAYSSLNSIRSALSFFIGKNVNIGSDDSLSRLFKYLL